MMSTTVSRKVGPTALWGKITHLPWLWSGVGALVLWVAIGAIAQRGMFATLQGTIQSGSFLVLAGLGQLLVISAGTGNIDLSIPGVMTLSSLTALTVADGDNSKVWLGVVVGIAVGLLVAILNIIAIFVVGIPPIVSTLATGLIVQSAVLGVAATLNAPVPQVLSGIASARVAGIPVVAVLIAVITVGAAIVLHRGIYGRHLMAFGQSEKAAERTGIAGVRVAALAYLASGMFAALSGILLAAFTGPSLSLGDPYLLTTVAVVVLGGSLIQGGRSTVMGLWTAMIMLNLILTLVYVMHWSVAVQDIFEGAVIVVVLILAGGARRVG